MTGSLAKSVKLFKIEAEKRHDNIFWAIILSSNNGELKHKQTLQSQSRATAVWMGIILLNSLISHSLCD